MTAFRAIVTILMVCIVSPAEAQKTAAQPVPTLSYADAADLALAAPIAAEVRVRWADRLKGELAPGLPANARRFLIEADVMALIRGATGLPKRITYIVDVRPGADGKWPKLERRQYLIFARPVPGKPASVGLVAPDAMQPASPALSALVRDILKDATPSSAPPRVTAVGQAFHTAGTIEGRGETQIFLNAEDGRPLSLSVWREPGLAPRWAVSLGEIVDESAEPPAKDSLLWYRLACALPQRLPEASIASLDAGNARIVSEDYATIIAGLGPCQRTRGTGNPVRSS